MPFPHSLRALASPNFRLYYAGQAVSMIGTWVQSLALMWLAYGLSGSTFFTGLVGFLNSAPYLVLSPFAGVLGDRLDRRRILLTVLSLLFLQSLALAVLSGTGHLTMSQLAALALFAGVANSFETPTRQSFFVQLLDNRDDLPNAIALNSVLMNGARLVGPSIGGLVIAAWGETACFAFNAVSYLVVIGALLRARPRASPPRPPSHPLADLADGWRYAMGFVPIRRMLLLLATLSITIGPYSSLMPAIAVKTFGEGAQLVGLFIGAVGFGAVVAAVSLARRPSVRGLAKWIGLSAIAAGLGDVRLLLFALHPPFRAAHGGGRLRHVHDRRLVQHHRPERGGRGQARARDELLHHVLHRLAAPGPPRGRRDRRAHRRAVHLPGRRDHLRRRRRDLHGPPAVLPQPPASRLRRAGDHPRHRRATPMTDTIAPDRRGAPATLAGKSLFITGASRGIGREIALRAARDGANVVIAAKTVEPHPKLKGTIHTVAAEIEAAGGKALAIQLDVRDDAAIAAAVEQAARAFGGLDILVNNASAISLTPTLETPAKRFDLMMGVNVRATFLCSQAAIPYLRKAAEPAHPDHRRRRSR